MQWYRNDTIQHGRRYIEAHIITGTHMERKGIHSKNDNVTNRINMAIPSKPEIVSYFGVLCYDNKKGRGNL
jgi:hypothetical protein